MHRSDFIICRRSGARGRHLRDVRRENGRYVNDSVPTFGRVTRRRPGHRVDGVRAGGPRLHGEGLATTPVTVLWPKLSGMGELDQMTTTATPIHRGRK